MGKCCSTYPRKKKIEDQIENNPIRTPKLIIAKICQKIMIQYIKAKIIYKI
jgi:hypothetical protein